ncbi:MAG: sulfatase [Saprospirales bacterium]|nr:sulfatase [Saprospirales bacterium]
MQHIFPLCLLCLLPAAGTAQSTRPNIIFIMSDDHAVQALSCYGSRLNQTPQIDRLAREGMRFDQAFCTNSICSPVRAVNLTGKFSHRNGVLDNLYPFDGSQPTAPKILRQSGYQTAMIGKWHLKSEPTGFDFWKILPGQGAYYNPDFLTAAGREKVEGYATTLITDFALQWLDRRDTSRPFFLMLHHKAPHRNWMPEEKYLHLFDEVTIPEPATLFDDYSSRSAAARQQEMRIADHMDLAYDLKVWEAPPDGRESWFRSETEAFLNSLTPAQRAAILAAYAGENARLLRDSLRGEALVRWKYQRYIKDYLRCIQSVDDQVGRVLDYLEAHGLAQNTLIFYTSDQGFYLGEHGWYDKRFMYEESYRQPLLLRWPGVIPPGSVSDALVMNVDFVPTFLDVAGAPAPGDLQGVSLKPLISSGQTPAGWRDATYYHYYEYPAVHAVKRHYGLRTKRYKLLHFYFDIDAWELYDLEKDPQELRNVYDDPAYFNIRFSLTRRLRQLQEYYGERPEDYLLPLLPDTIDHLARTASCVLQDQPGQLHSRDTAHFLTDGLYRAFSPYNAGLQEGYGGFREHPLRVVLDFGRPVDFQEVGLHCRQVTPSWVYYPAWLQVFSADDGQDFQLKTEMKIPAEAPDGSRWFTIPGITGRARFIKIVATPLENIPEGMPGAGNRGWLFADEVFVR